MVLSVVYRAMRIGPSRDISHMGQPKMLDVNPKSSAHAAAPAVAAVAASRGIFRFLQVRIRHIEDAMC